ncbi:MAG: hypothetical protein E6G31_08245 [Actinobacteria bacterium]|jgi:hypothetical protein|nr:MAG: hypothetical protein E6G31_08245 [Actinomycetota bacterium]
MSSFEPQTRALTRILDDCARLTADSRPTAVTRLRQTIGEELARLLLRSLSGDHRRVGLAGV